MKTPFKLLILAVFSILLLSCSRDPGIVIHEEPEADYIKLYKNGEIFKEFDVHYGITPDTLNVFGAATGGFLQTWAVSDSLYEWIGWGQVFVGSKRSLVIYIPKGKELISTTMEVTGVEIGMEDSTSEGTFDYKSNTINYKYLERVRMTLEGIDNEDDSVLNVEMDILVGRVE